MAPPPAVSPTEPLQGTNPRVLGVTHAQPLLVGRTRPPENSTTRTHYKRDTELGTQKLQAPRLLDTLSSREEALPSRNMANRSQQAPLAPLRQLQNLSDGQGGQAATPARARVGQAAGRSLKMHHRADSGEAVTQWFRRPRGLLSHPRGGGGKRERDAGTAD